MPGSSASICIRDRGSRARDFPQGSRYRDPSMCTGSDAYSDDARDATYTTPSTASTWTTDQAS